jgi:hypothetical protein
VAKQQTPYTMRSVGLIQFWLSSLVVLLLRALPSSPYGRGY